MLLSIRRNFALKMLSLILALIGWAYFRFATNPLTTARFDQQLSVPVTAVNLPAGYVARYSDKTAIVTVEPKRGDPAIKPEEIKAVLDLSNRAAGVYNVPVQLVAPNLAIQSLSPASVTLTIAKIDQKSFPLAVHYGGDANVVVRAFSLTPQVGVVRGPTDELSQVATVRVDIPLSASKSSLDEMIRPIAVNSSGQEIGDVQVVPNLVRVQAQFLPATGAAHGP